MGCRRSVSKEFFEHFEGFDVVHGIPGPEESVGIALHDVTTLAQAHILTEPLIRAHIGKAILCVGLVDGNIGGAEERDLQKLRTVQRAIRREREACPGRRRGVGIAFDGTDARENTDASSLGRAERGVRIPAADVRVIEGEGHRRENDE